MLRRSVKFQWQSSILFIALISRFVSAIQPTSRIDSENTTRVDHKQLIDHSWSNLEDVLAVRKFEKVGEDVTDLPVGFYRELTKILTFPTALHAKDNVTSQQCVEDSLFYVDNLLIHGSDWAIQMLETTGQLPASIIGNGNYHAEGLFDECQAIRSVPSRFKGQYCTVFFNIEELEELDYAADSDSENEDQNNPSVLFLLRRLFGPSVEHSTRIKPRLARPSMTTATHNYPSISICLPSSCSASDLGKSLAQLIGSYIIAGNQSIVTIADENLCFTDDRVLPPLDGPAITVILICSLIILLVLLATAHEAWRNYNGISSVTETDSTIVSFLHCFSAISNGRSLLSFKAKVLGTDNLTCLSGIRFICATCVVFYHSSFKITSVGSNYLVNPNTFQQISKYLMYLTSTDFTFVVDTFLVVSAILVSYNIFKGLDHTSGKLNFKHLYIQRYIRMTVVYGMVLAIISTLSIYRDLGPNWYYLSLMSEKCRNNWWKHVLYINNFFHFDMNECFSDSWYLAVDMQLFLVAPFFIYLIWRWKKSGLITLATFILGSLAANAAILATYNLPQNVAGLSINSDEEKSIAYMNLIYNKIWTRAPPYLIGILTGWFLYNEKHSKLLLSLKNLFVLWTLFFVLFCYVLFGTNLNIYFKESLPELDLIIRLVYGSFHRTAWALAIVWIIVACTNGYGGFINRFLSWKGFIPLSRLSYCVYLLQWNYLTAFYASQRKRLFFTTFNYLTMTGGFVIAIYFLAFLLALFIEIPSINLMKFVFSFKLKSRNTREF